MKLASSISSRSSRKSIDDNMIPMINIIFLLLIFYLVAGKIQTSLVKDLELPENTEQNLVKQSTSILQISADNTLFFNGTQISLAELDTELSSQPDDSELNIQLYADFRLTASQLDQTLERLRQYNVQKIEIISQQPL